MAQAHATTVEEQVSSDTVDVTDDFRGTTDASDADMRVAAQLAAMSADVFDNEETPVKANASRYSSGLQVVVKGSLSMHWARRAVESEPYEVTGLLAYGHGGCRVDLQRTDSDD